jgi:hypothetical protein
MFDLLLVFEDCIEFSEERSDGWELLGLTDRGVDAPMTTIVRDCLSVLLQRYRTYQTDIIFRDAIWHALSSAYQTANYSCMKIILEFDPGLRSYTECVSNSSELDIFGQFMFYMTENLFAQQVFIDRGIDLVTKFGGETPTSRSLRFSCIFFGWRHEARFASPDVERLLVQETSEGTILNLQGWHPDTLRDLFELEPTAQLTQDYGEARLDLHGAEPSCTHLGCSKSAPAYGIAYHGIIVEPWWEKLKHLVKSGMCHCSMQEWVHDTRQDNGLCHNHPNRGTIGDFGIPEMEDHGAAMLTHGLVARGPRGYAQETNKNALAALRIEHYYIKYEGFRHEYQPQQYWCFHCLACREGWELDEGWEPTGALSDDMEVDSDTEEGSNSEEGHETDDDAWDASSDDESMSGEDPG